MNHKLNSILIALFVIVSLPAMADQACEIKEQSGFGEAMWCSNHQQKGIIRCYAEVEYRKGDVRKIWGDVCYDSYSDCWSSGAGAVEPDCSK